MLHEVLNAVQVIFNNDYWWEQVFSQSDDDALTQEGNCCIVRPVETPTKGKNYYSNRKADQ